MVNESKPVIEEAPETGRFRDEYLTIKEAAEALRVHEQTVRTWIWQRKLRAFRVGKRGPIRVSRIDLDLLIETAKALLDRQMAKRASRKPPPGATPRSRRQSRAAKSPRR